MKVSVDFETRSPVDLKKQGSYVYFEHAQTEVLMCAYRIDDGPLRIWTFDQPRPDDLCRAIELGATICAWNASFEALGFDLLADRHGWPRPKIEQYSDTMAAAAAMSLPRALGDAAAALGLEVQKDKEGQRLIRKFSIPRRDGTFNDPFAPENRDDWEKFKSYCCRDVEVEEAIAKRIVPLSEAEQRLWTLNLKINRRGIRIDRTSAKSALVIAEKAKKRLDAEMRRATGGYVPACSQPGKLVEWVQSQGLALDSAGKAEITDLLSTSDLPANVREALEIRQEAAKTSVSKLSAMLAMSNADGRVRGTSSYHAAGTGRFQSQGVNFNNMPRPRREFDDAHPRLDVLFDAFRREDPEWLKFLYGPVVGKPLHLISDAIRGFVWAGPGKEFVQADYSNIEGNVVAWSANEEWKLKAIRELNANPDLPDMYRRTAAAILGLTTDEITKKHWARQAVGKPAELGLAYGGGVMAFVTFARGYNVDLEGIARQILAQADGERIEKAAKRYEGQMKRGKSGTTELSRDAWIACEVIKLGWRAQNSAIAQSWRDLEGVVREAVAEPGKVTQAAKVQYLVAQGFLWARLPSGRCLAYGAPRLKAQVWAKVLLPDGTWSDSEVLDREAAQKGELAGTVRIEGETSDKVTALGVNSVTRKWERFGLYGGLLTENCLSGNTEVLTLYGWKRITDIQPTDKLWDGLTWVAHGGLVRKSSEITIDIAGVRMTPDHKVWTNEGWVRAEDADVYAVTSASPDPEFDRAALRAAGGSWLRRWRRQKGLVEGPMRLRHDEVVRRFGASQGQDAKLRLLRQGSGFATSDHTRHVKARGLRSLEQHARPLRATVAQSLRALWRTRHLGLRTLAQIRKLLAGHGAVLGGGPDDRTPKQPRGLFARQLRLAEPQSASAKQAQQRYDRHAEGPDAGLRSFGDKRIERNDHTVPSGCGLADSALIRRAGFGAPHNVEPVFDILNAGSRHRFTVKGANGPIIVSNCTQAIARDLLVNGMWKAEEAGYPVVATVYDEILAEVPRGYGDVREFEKLICELPPWADGLPLTAGGWRGKRFRKD